MSDLSRYVPQDSETVKRIYAWHERMETAKEGPHHGRMGASVIGRPCDRFLWYFFRKLYGRQFTGRMLRLFETGHLEEPRFVRELRGIGCTVLEVEETTGKQFEFTALGGHFVCHPDALILGIPESPKTWHAGEFKTMGGTETELSKDFEKVKKEGVATAKPEHYSQMQCAMGLGKLTRALYLAKKKATDELHAERVHYDAGVFKGLMDRAERIIRASSAPDRCAQRPDDFRCRFCDSFALCWGMGETAVPLPRKTCHSCCHATPEIDEGEDWARWSCALRHDDLSPQEQYEACDAHLLLPSLVSFAEATDAGDDWIEFTNTTDGAVWRHGAGEGMWTTDELMLTPGPLVGEKSIEAVKAAFKGSVTGFEDGDDNLTLIERYPPEDSRLRWEGQADDHDSIRTALDGTGVDLALQPEYFEDAAHEAHEWEKRVLLVIYKGHDYAAIWEGSE